MNKGDNSTLAARAVDGLLAAHFRLPDPAALSNTFIDYLHLACGGSYRVRLKSGNVEDGSDKELVTTGVRVGRSELVLEAVDARRARGGEDGIKSAASCVKSVVDLLQERHRSLWTALQRHVLEALVQAPPAIVSHLASDQTVSIQERLLTRVEERIRQSLAEYEQTGSPREVFLSKDPGPLRIVTIHRYFQNGVPYGRLVFTETQSDLLAGAAPPQEPGTAARGSALAAPLASFPPAIRLCFESGFALYGSWQGLERAPAFADVVKRALGLRPGAPVPKACFIPCHVGGVAWTVSAVTNPVIDTGFADVCVQLYREWIPRLFEALRSSTQADFLGWLLDSYQRGLARPVPDRSAINEEWACIRQCYPLPQWELEAAPSRSDDEHFLRLPKIQGQTWVIPRHGSSNEYYLPPDRLSQPASWGSGSLWGETLLQRLREITEYTSQWHDLQRLRAVQQAVGSWAHEVKSYTVPIIGDLRSALRQTKTAEPAFEPTRRALRATVILNACSFAAQKILENRAAPSAETRMFLLPARRCRDIVEATLQYLLQYWRVSSPKALILEWEPQLSEREALTLLAAALGDEGAADDEVLLTSPAVVGVVSLLREVVFNIRCDSPIDTPVVRMSHRISREAQRLNLTLEQYSRERFEWSRNADQPKGVTRANRLYGPEGAQLGHILPHRPVQTSVEGGVSVKYVVEVEFNLAT